MRPSREDQEEEYIRVWIALRYARIRLWSLLLPLTGFGVLASLGPVPEWVLWAVAVVVLALALDDVLLYRVLRQQLRALVDQMVPPPED
jgi:hypothetical protein